MSIIRKYIVVQPDGQKAKYDDYNMAVRHAQLICRDTVFRPQITIKTLVGDKWVSEIKTIPNHPLGGTKRF